MAKLSMIQREIKRVRTAEKFAAQRTELKGIVGNTTYSFEDRMQAQEKLQKLPRNASPTRQRSRCQLTGRSRGYYRKFGLCRNKLREFAMKGDIPGLVKASW